MFYYFISKKGTKQLARSDGPPQETRNVVYCPVCKQQRYLSEEIEILSPTGEWVQERLCTGHNAVARINDREALAYRARVFPGIPL